MELILDIINKHLERKTDELLEELRIYRDNMNILKDLSFDDLSSALDVLFNLLEDRDVIKHILEEVFKTFNSDFFRTAEVYVLNELIEVSNNDFKIRIRVNEKNI